MDRNVKKLLDALEPAIDEKCIEINEKRKRKVEQRVFIAATMMFLILPSLLMLLGINIIYFIVIMAIIISIIMFMTLPFLIKMNIQEDCYE